jgi:hypothetical protein
VLLAFRVSALYPVVAGAGFGLKDAVTPLGKPETEKLTLPAKPYRGLILKTAVA